MPESNYQLAYREACRALAVVDPLVAAANAACRFDRESSFFEIEFLGRAYRVSHPDGAVTPGQAVPPGAAPAMAADALLTASILILHYLIKAAGLPAGSAPAPAGEWIAFRELPGGGIYVGPFTNRTIRPMVAAFERQPGRLVEAALRLGGRKESFGHASASVPVFGRVPVCFVVWEGDEEIPASGQVLFDRSASEYLDTEDLVVAASEALFALRFAAEPGRVARPGTLEQA